MKNTILTITFIVLSMLPYLSVQDCTNGWWITGYYVPYEKDFKGKKVPLNVGGQIFSFKEDFIADVKIQGSGYTEAGWVLSCCWERRNGIIGACGKTLTPMAAVARDPRLFQCGLMIVVSLIATSDNA